MPLFTHNIALASGFFVDPVEREVEEAFMPWLHQAAAKHLELSLIADAVVEQIVADAVTLQAEQVAASKAAADAELAAAEAAAAQAAEAAAKHAAAELAAIRSRAAFILNDLQPPVVDEEQAQQARAELITQATGDVEAAWEAERARFGEARRAELEAAAAAAAEQQVRFGLLGSCWTLARVVHLGGGYTTSCRSFQRLSST